MLAASPKIVRWSSSCRAHPGTRNPCRRTGVFRMGPPPAHLRTFFQMCLAATGAPSRRTPHRANPCRPGRARCVGRSCSRPDQWARAGKISRPKRRLRTALRRSRSSRRRASTRPAGVSSSASRARHRHTPRRPRLTRSGACWRRQNRCRRQPELRWFRCFLLEIRCLLPAAIPLAPFPPMRWSPREIAARRPMLRTAVLTPPSPQTIDPDRRPEGPLTPRLREAFRRVPFPPG